MADPPQRPARSRESRPAIGTDAISRWLAPTAETRTERIPVDRIDDRRWPSMRHDHDADVALRRSIAAHGILEPLLLRHRPGGRFELLLGARRLALARRLGLSDVPAIVRDLDDAATAVLWAWSAVASGGDALDPGDVAERLSEAGVDDEEIAALLGTIASDAPATRAERIRLRPRSGLRPARYAAAGSAVDALIDALGDHLAAALAAVLPEETP